MEYDWDEDAEGGSGFTADDVQKVIEQLKESGNWTIPSAPLSLSETINWRPDLVSSDGKSVFHAHFDTRLRSYLVTRMRLAREKGFGIHVALPLDRLWNDDLLRVLSSIQALVLVLRESLSVKSLPLLRALAEEQIAVPSDLRKVLAREGWSDCRSGGLTSYQKGQKLEALLGFLLSQVGDFRVVEYNLRTNTEELDLVVQVSRLFGVRCWVLPNHPFIIVEAKNWSAKVGQPEVSQLYTKVVTKRRTVRIALLVGANGFTDDADRQVLKLALGDEILVLIGPDEIEAWIEGGEDGLEKLIRRAMLR